MIIQFYLSTTVHPLQQYIQIAPILCSSSGINQNILPNRIQISFIADDALLVLNVTNSAVITPPTCMAWVIWPREQTFVASIRAVNMFLLRTAVAGTVLRAPFYLVFRMGLDNGRLSRLKTSRFPSSQLYRRPSQPVTV